MRDWAGAERPEADDGGAGVRWSVGVLASGLENTASLEAGTAATVAAARAAATAALVRAVRVWGRAEYRLSVAGVAVMVIPGLTGEGSVDVDDVRDTLYELDAFTIDS